MVGLHGLSVQGTYGGSPEIHETHLTARKWRHEQCVLVGGGETGSRQVLGNIEQ